MKRPTLAEPSPPLADLSLNCVIRRASPKPVRHSSTHAACVCAGTWLCTKIVARSGSTPAARSCATETRVRSRSSFGSCGIVIECRSATKKNGSNSSWNVTHCFSAPRKLPRWNESAVGWMPESTRGRDVPVAFGVEADMRAIVSKRPGVQRASPSHESCW